TLENMHEVYRNRQITLVRELTKLYEEYQRGSISEILDYIASNPLKGECLLIVAGASENGREESLTSDVTPVEAVEALIASGMKPNQAIKTVAKERKINRQELYNLFHGV
ncbi:MAG: 16S rRNA (cytidine(1402)-2'-O)-methyltransferase, partial [Streptococcus sp.]|nr:16S rRNA (cytidine(1402)-2'-O)-methyltransferase [Streptococcus sp.]